MTTADLMLALAGKTATILAYVRWTSIFNGRSELDFSGTITSSTAYAAPEPSLWTNKLVSRLNSEAKVDAGTEHVLKPLPPGLEIADGHFDTAFDGVLFAGQGRMYKNPISSGELIHRYKVWKGGHGPLVSSPSAYAVGAGADEILKMLAQLQDNNVNLVTCSR